MIEMIASFCSKQGLNLMTSRGPFLPQFVCDSVVISSTTVLAGSLYVVYMNELKIRSLNVPYFVSRKLNYTCSTCTLSPSDNQVHCAEVLIRYLYLTTKCNTYLVYCSLLFLIICVFWCVYSSYVCVSALHAWTGKLFSPHPQHFSACCQNVAALIYSIFCSIFSHAAYGNSSTVQGLWQ